MEQEKSKLHESCVAFEKVLLAAGAVWKDSTLYGRDDKKRIPTAFSTNIGSCRISISCEHIHYKPDWSFRCLELGFDAQRIGKELTAQEAAEKAVAICKDKARMLYDAFRNCK